MVRREDENAGEYFGRLTEEPGVRDCAHPVESRISARYNSPALLNFESLDEFLPVKDPPSQTPLMRHELGRAAKMRNSWTIWTHLVASQRDLLNDTSQIVLQSGEGTQ